MDAVQWLTLGLPVANAASFTHLPSLTDPWRHLTISYKHPFMAQRPAGSILPINAELVRVRALEGHSWSTPLLPLHFQMHFCCLHCADNARAVFSFYKASKVVSTSDQNRIFTSQCPARMSSWASLTHPKIRHMISEAAHLVWGDVHMDLSLVMLPWAHAGHPPAFPALPKCPFMSFIPFNEAQKINSELLNRLAFSRIARNLRKVEYNDKNLLEKERLRECR